MKAAESSFTSVRTVGDTVHYQIEGHEEFIAVPVGVFAEPGFPAPTRSVYERRKHAWVTVPPQVEHLA